MYPFARFSSPYRGRGRGRGSGANREWIANPRLIQIPPLPTPKDEQHHIATISSAEEALEVSSMIGITGCQYLASYNWVQRGKTILIPGLPPKWTPPTAPQRLREDTGEYFRDQNGARNPSFPYEAGIRSIFAQAPDFGGQDVDIVACGNTLGSLLNFACGQERTFRFGVEKIGRTIFLIRREATPRAVIENIRGYGHAFPDAYTTWDVSARGSVSHQRLLRYKLGNLTCVVRVEVDGYLPKPEDQSPSTNMSMPKSPRSMSMDDDDSRLTALSLSTASDSDDKVDLSLRDAGHVVPQEGLFDLKTRSTTSVNPIDMTDQLRRMWVTRIPNFILAKHSRGEFSNEEIHVEKVSDQVLEWEQANQAGVRRLRDVLVQMSDIAEHQKNHKIEVRRSGMEDLHVWTEEDDWSALPEVLAERWLCKDPGRKEAVKGEVKYELDKEDVATDAGVVDANAV